MIDRRRILALLAAGTASPALAADLPLMDEPLADQPDLPGPLSRYRDLPVRRIDGEPSTLTQLLGPPRPTVVSFWATWCAPCALEGQRLAQVRMLYPDERLAIIGLNIDRPADRLRVAQFRRRAQMNYTQGLDAKAAYLAMTARSRVALPRTYVFDAGGRPTAAFGRFFGARTLKALDEAIHEAVKSGAPARLAAGRRAPR